MDCSQSLLFAWDSRVDKVGVWIDNQRERRRPQALSAAPPVACCRPPLHWAHAGCGRALEAPQHAWSTLMSSTTRARMRAALHALC